MNKFLIISGLFFALGLSVFLLISRKKQWCTDKFRIGLTGSLFVIGTFGLIFLETQNDDLITFLKWIQIPLINSLIDRLFRFISYKIHDRDLLLYARGSSDLDHSSKKPNLKTSDYLFSILLIIFIFTLPIYGL